MNNYCLPRFYPSYMCFTLHKRKLIAKILTRFSFKCSLLKMEYLISTSLCSTRFFFMSWIVYWISLTAMCIYSRWFKQDKVKQRRHILFVTFKQFNFNPSVLTDHVRCLKLRTEAKLRARFITLNHLFSLPLILCWFTKKFPV